MNFSKFIAITGLSGEATVAASTSLAECKRRAKGSTWKKWKTRLFQADNISDKLAWSNNRLIEVEPNALDQDIEPVTKISANGDNGPWDGMPGRPIEDCWMNDDPNSQEYKDAVASCYWSKGNHPRSKKARKDWYRRNGGAGYVYRIGCPVDPNEFKIFRGRKGRTEIVLFKSGEAWQMHVYTHLIAGLKWYRRVGYEVENVFSGVYAPQAWFPVPGHELKAPVSWSEFGGLTLKDVYSRRDHFAGVEQTQQESE